MTYTHRPKIHCACLRCVNVGRNRRNAVIVALLLVVMIVGAALSASAQIPIPEPVIVPGQTVCLYHPETLQRIDPAQRQVIVHTRTYGWPSPVAAIPFIRSEWPSSNADRQTEAISAAIQYSIYLSPGKTADAQRVMLADYLPGVGNVPELSLYSAARQYLWTGNLIQRSELAYWLRRVIESRSNGDCNPWHPYRTGGEQ
jgi:hypothetical protein